MQISWQKSIDVVGTYDVVVCGGGPAGTVAAIAAKRMGLDVLLLEGEGQLGGIGTSGLVSHWLGGRTNDCKQWVVGGIFKELATESTARGIALLPEPQEGKYSPHGWNWEGGQLTAGVPFDPFEMALYYDEKMAQEGVDVLLKTRVIDVQCSGNRIEHVIFQNKSGIQAVKATAVIDATGDADVAHFSGCDTVLGREQDRLMTPVTLQVHMSRIDQQALSDYIHAHKSFRLLPEIEAWTQQGEWPFTWNRFISVLLTDDDVFMVNSPRITGIDGTDGRSVTQGYQQGRKEIYQLLEIMRKKIAGCKEVRIKAIAGLLGVRETRRIVGDFRLTIEDLRQEIDLPDIIGYTAYGWDLPLPDQPSVNPDVGKERGIRRTITPIPYRVMLPRPIENLICPGRALSVEREILGPMREMAPCMAMGEAAGTACGQVVKQNLHFAQVDTDRLRQTLATHDAVVDWDF